MLSKIYDELVKIRLLLEEQKTRSIDADNIANEMKATMVDSLRGSSPMVAELMEKIITRQENRP
jgi:RNA-binding protein YhbY